MFFTITDTTGVKLFTGTKNDCKHFIKCRKLNRSEVSIKEVPTRTTHVEECIYSNTELVKSTKPESFFNRMFKK